MCPASLSQAIDEKLIFLSQARKFLPYGFGPGSRTVIEEAGDIDDDEEDYGDYQVLETRGACLQEG